VATRVTSTRLVGRSAQLAELEAALADAGDGTPSLALVAGESGVGKTRLLAELRRRAVAGGARVLAGDAVELGEGELPYAALVGALRQLARDDDPVLHRLPALARNELGRMLPALAGGEAPAPTGDRSAQARLFEALLTLLEVMGRDAPVLLVLEDLHWADTSTRAFLAFLSRALCAERVLVVASFRPDELHRRHPLRALLAELERDAAVRRLELAPLSRSELADALEDILGAPPAPDLLERLHARSEGNPLFMEELLATGLDGRGALPPTLRDALTVRVDRLGEPAQEVLRALAVGGRLDHELLLAATGLDERVLRDALREAVASHIVAVGEEGVHLFRHALLREVVQDDLLPGERTQLHRALARALEARAEARGVTAHVAAGIAHHHLAAGDDGAALVASLRAADAAERVHAHGEAAALLERALDLWERTGERGGLDRADLLRRAALAHDLAGERSRAETLLAAAVGEVDAQRAPVRVGELLTRLARVQFALNRSDAAMTTARRALALLEAQAPTPELAALLSWWAKVRMLQGKFRKSVQTAEEAKAVAEALGLPGPRSEALMAMGPSLIALGEVDRGEALLRETLAAAVAAGSERDVDMIAVNLADALHLAGRSRAAGEVLRASAERLEDSPYPHHWLRLMEGEVAFDLGDWERAAASLPRHDRRFEGRALMYVELRRAHLALGRGAHEDAAEHLARLDVLAAESTEPQFQAPVGALLAELRRRQGDLAGARGAVDAALDRLEFCTEDVRRLAVVAAAGVAVEADAAQRARDLGDHGETAAAVDRAHDLLERVRAAASDGRPVEQAHLATAEADARRAAGLHDPDAWARAARAWEAVERPYAAAATRWGEAEAHLARERAGTGATDRDGRQAACAAVAEALATAERLGADWLADELRAFAARARLRLDAVVEDGAESPAAPEAETPFGLTPRELAVLALVARGATNRQIGAELYMAEKTASVHVSRILAKLDVRSRTQAAAVAHRLGLAEQPV